MHGCMDDAYSPCPTPRKDPSEAYMHARTHGRTDGRTDVLEEAREEFAALHVVGRLPLLEERQELAQVLTVLVSVEVVVVWGGKRGGLGGGERGCGGAMRGVVCVCMGQVCTCKLSRYRYTKYIQEKGTRKCGGGRYRVDKVKNFVLRIGGAFAAEMMTRDECKNRPPFSFDRKGNRNEVLLSHD